MQKIDGSLRLTGGQDRKSCRPAPCPRLLAPLPSLPPGGYLHPEINDIHSPTPRKPARNPESTEPTVRAPSPAAPASLEVTATGRCENTCGCSALSLYKTSGCNSCRHKCSLALPSLQGPHFAGYCGETWQEGRTGEWDSVPITNFALFLFACLFLSLIH